jgi:hypothetical protein
VESEGAYLVSTSSPSAPLCIDDDETLHVQFVCGEVSRRSRFVTHYRRQLSFAPLPPTPTRDVVLVHGAWADGSSWSKVIPLLVAVGYQVNAVQNSLSPLADDAAATKREIERTRRPGDPGRSLARWPNRQRSGQQSKELRVSFELTTLLPFGSN